MRVALSLPRTRPRVAEQPPRLVNLLARLDAARLDRELAAGIVPWTSPRHAARALQLTSSRRRVKLARRLERLLMEARYPPLGGNWLRVLVRPPCRSVLACESHVTDLARMLRSSGPVDVRGVARLNRLLRSRVGPLYTYDGTGWLKPVLQQIAELTAAGER